MAVNDEAVQKPGVRQAQPSHPLAYIVVAGDSRLDCEALNAEIRIGVRLVCRHTGWRSYGFMIWRAFVDRLSLCPSDR